MLAMPGDARRCWTGRNDFSIRIGHYHRVGMRSTVGDRRSYRVAEVSLTVLAPRLIMTIANLLIIFDETGEFGVDFENWAITSPNTKLSGC